MFSDVEMPLWNVANDRADRGWAFRAILAPPRAFSK
jgi:hypothetical protein